MRFDAAIHGKHYLPSDENQNLSDTSLNVRQMAYEVIDMAYPAPKPVQSCSAEANPN